MKSDEMVTGSVSRVPREEEQTPDTEVKEMGVGGKRAPVELSSPGEGGQATQERPGAAAAADSASGSSEASDRSPEGASEVRKPRLTKEQQEWLNKVFIPNFRKELMRQVHFDRKLLEQHKRELERRKKEEESFRTALRVAQQENDGLLRRISDLKIDRALVSAAAANNAVNPEQVRKLLKERVRLGEDLEPVVLDEKGERQLNQNGDFMTVEEQVKLFLAENPHLVKAGPAKGGSGSVGSGWAGHAVAAGATSSGDLIAEGLLEEGTKPPTRALAEFEEK